MIHAVNNGERLMIPKPTGWLVRTQFFKDYKTIPPKLRAQSIALYDQAAMNLVQSGVAEAPAQAGLPGVLEPLSGNEADPIRLWAEIWKLRNSMRGPEGFETWQDAAVDERIRRVKAEAALPKQKPKDWVGCGECDLVFPCHNGKRVCLRSHAMGQVHDTL